MPFGNAAGGLAEGIVQGLRGLSTLQQADYRQAQEHSARLQLYMRALDTVTKSPETLGTIRQVLQPYGMDIDQSVLANVEQTRKAQDSIGRFLTSGDFDTFAADVQNNPQFGALISRNPTLEKLVTTATERAETTRALTDLTSAAKTRGLTPQSAEWNAFLREQAVGNPRIGAYLKGNAHLFGPELTAEQSQAATDRRTAAYITDAVKRGAMSVDKGFSELRGLPSGVGIAAIQNEPIFAEALHAARRHGDIRGEEQTLAMPYDELVGGTPRNLTDLVPPGGVPVAPAATTGTPQLRWGPADFTLRSGPAMALLGGQMDEPIPAAAPAPAPPPPIGPAVRGAPLRPGQTVGDVRAERDRARSYDRAAAGAEARNDTRADAAVTWQPYYGEDGKLVGFYNPKNPSETRPAPPGMAGRTPRDAGGGGGAAVTWQPYYGADGKLAGFYNPHDPSETRPAPEGMAGKTPRDANPPPPKAGKPADMMTVLNAAREMPAPAPTAGQAKDADAAARVRASLMTKYQTELNASLGDAGMAANAAMRKAGWDPQTIRAAQGKTAQYLAGSKPSTTASAPPAAPAPAPAAAAPGAAPGPASGAQPAPARATDAQVRAEYARLRKAGLDPQTARAAMQAGGWPVQ